MIFVLLCICLQDDEISYYNAKDNVSVLFPSAYLLSFHFNPANSQVTLGHGPVIWLCYTAPSLSVLPFTSSSSLLSSIFLFLFTTFMSYFFLPWLSIIASAFYCNPPPLFCLSPGFSARVASSPSSLLPPFLRWRGFCHVSPLIDRWDVWAGYTVALLGSNCSHSLSLPPLVFSLSLHFTTSLPLYPAFFPPYLIMLFFIYLPVCTALIDVNWCMHGRSYKSPQGA